jgi:hypothetical protein
LNVSTFSSQFNSKDGTGVSIFYADFSKANASPRRVADDIEQLVFVKKVKIEEMGSRHFDRFLFPPTIRDGRRVLMVSAEAFMRLERDMRDRMGSAGSSTMFNHGHDFAVSSMTTYKEAIGDYDEFLIEVLDSLRVQGWGIIELVDRDSGSFNFLIGQPPVLDHSAAASNYGEDPAANPVDGKLVVEAFFLYGMLAGILETYTGERYVVSRSRFDPQSSAILLSLESLGDSR